MQGVQACFRCCRTEHLMARWPVKLDALQCCQVASYAIRLILDVVDIEGKLAVSV